MAGSKLHMQKDAIDSRRFRESVDAFTKMLGALAEAISPSSRRVVSVNRESMSLAARCEVDQGEAEHEDAHLDTMGGDSKDIVAGNRECPLPASSTQGLPKP